MALPERLLVDSGGAKIIFPDIGGPKIDFVRTVPRHLAHKRRIENVYVTSMSRVAEGVFVCGAYVPQANVYLNEMRANPNDVTLTIVEIGRQIGIALCHEYMGVERANAFILNTMALEILPAWYGVDWAADDTLVIQVFLKDSSYDADGKLRSVKAEGYFLANGALVCKQTSDWTIQPVERYQRLREISRGKAVRAVRPEPMPPFQGEGLKIKSSFPVKKPVLDEVLWVGYGGKAFSAELQVDQSNMFFFDHANDHVPGMLILEGMRELAADVASRFPRNDAPRVTQVNMGFKSFAELDQPVAIVAEVVDMADCAGSRELYIDLKACQGGRLLATGAVIVD